MMTFISENGPIQVCACSDVELISLICLRRLPTEAEAEAWANAGSVAAKLAIRSMPEFIDKNTYVAFTADRAARTGMPYDRELLYRLYRIFIGRAPISDEEAYFSEVGTLATDDLVRRLMRSPESMVFDGVLSDEVETEFIRATQVAANKLNFDLYAHYYLEGTKIRGKLRSKAVDLSRGHIDVLLGIGDVSEEDIYFVREAASVRWPDVDCRIHLTTKKVEVEDIEPYDIFITNNNSLYGYEEQIFQAARAANCFTACWLWDNHHQFDLSSRVAHAFDLVFPAHSNGSTYLHSGNAVIGNVIPCCAFQWYAAEANDLYIKNGSGDRSNAIYGRFNSYPGRLALRDQFLIDAAANLDGNQIQLISFDSNDWFAKTRSQRFFELSSYSVILVNSIFNDVPARLFEALLVGAIPVVPHGLPDIGLSFTPEEQKELPIVTYLPNDVNSLREAWAVALELFSNGGAAAAEHRHKLVASRHMLRNRISTMLIEAIDVSSRFM